MDFDRNELEERLRATTPRDTVRGMMFKGVMVEAGRRFGPDRAGEVQRRVAPQGWRDFFSYPAADFLKMMFELTELGQAGGASRAEMQRFCGAATADAFFASTIGKTLLLLWSSGGPPKLLHNAPGGYRQVVSYGVRTFLPQGERAGVMQFRQDMMPAAYHEGVFQACFRALRAEVEMESRPLSLVDLDIHFRWK
jgi:uncharacterized protein (TIGR02265 family)